MPDPGTAPGPVTKQERIVSELRRLVLSGELPRGARLAQDELAARFGVSITPVREALRVLQVEGLVESWPNRGMRVAGVDADRLVSIYVQRRLGESFAMSRAASRMSRLDLAAAQQHLTELDRCAADDDLAGVRAANERFHFECIEQCGLPHLTGWLRGLWAAFPWDLVIGGEKRSAASRREHLEIMRALRAGDGDRAAAATERHIAGGFQALAVHLHATVTDPFDSAE